MKLTEIKLTKAAEVAYIRLNRPEKLNSLTEVMLKEWRAVLEDLENDSSCRVIVITGEGKAFSAGVDLEVFQTIKVEPGFQMWEDGIAIMKLLEYMPQVTICMLNGYCFTGAMEIMMAFDLIVAAEEAKIGDTHSKWSIPPKWGMTQRLQQQVGLRKAKELSFTAKAISGKEAERIGLVNHAVPLEQLADRTNELVQDILKNSAQTIAVEKELYQYGSVNGLQDGLNYEAEHKSVLNDKQDDLKNFKSKIN